jgi:hypothetical protein
VSTEDRKILTLLTMLTKLTSEKKLTWEATTPHPGIVAGTDHVVPLYFETSYKNQRIALFERRYQGYSGEHDHLYWTEQVTLAFLDGARRNIWEYTEPSASLFNLFELVRRSVANVDSLIDDLLSSGESENL